MIAMENSDPSLVTSDPMREEQPRQLASILGRGVRRYRSLVRRYESEASAEAGESRGDCLEVVDETRLSVSRFRGLSARDQQ